MTIDGQREVRDLHVFFEGWFKGSLPRTPEAFARFDDMTTPDFHLVTPAGRVVGKSRLEAMLESEHGSWNQGQHRIWIANYTERARATEILLATYEEHQEHNGAATCRLSSVLFQVAPEAPNGLRWMHVHETMTL
ncbi:MAG: hypothetical protein ACYTGR_09790 [Planctomycetota bacterium]